MIEEEKYWVHVEFYNQDNPNPDNGFVVYIKNDTLINGETYKFLYKSRLSGYHPCPPDQRPCFTFDFPYKMIYGPQLLGFVRENEIERKVYYLPSREDLCANQGDELLFDFSKSLGDTLSNCQVNTLGGLSHFGLIKKDSIKNHHLKTRRFVQTTGYQNAVGLLTEGDVDIYEGFGYDHGGIIGIMTLVDFCEGPPEDCDIISSVIDQVKPSIHIYPIPFINTLNIEADIVYDRLELYTIEGKCLGKFNGVNQINTSNLKLGIYVLVLCKRNGEKISKLIKKIY